MNNFYSSPLLVPISVGSLKLKNRMVVPPMGILHSMDGSVDEQTIQYYERKAKGGFAMIFHSSSLGFSEDILTGHQLMCDRIHKAGAKIISQVGHPGRQVGSKCIAPSPIPCMMNDVIPHELTIEEIHAIVEQFTDKAEFSKRAGYDGVEIHGAHGYLIAEFMSTYANKRVDEYGGCLENRMRFPLEIIKRVREKCGYDFTLGFRISGDEFVPGGRTIEVTKAIAVMLEKAGIDFIDVSGAVYGSEENYMSPMEFPEAYLADLAKEIKSVVNIPVIAANRIKTVKVAESLILSEKCDLVGMGRASLADPELPNKFFAGKCNEIRPCISCNQGCLHSLNTWKPIACMVNPEISNEYKNELKPAEVAKNVSVIGAGPAGMYAAITARKAGHNVTIYEKNNYLGGNFYLAAIPPTKGTMAEFTAWQVAELKRLGVNIVMGTEFTLETFNKTKPDSVIIATGSTPIVPNIKGIDNEKVVLASDVLLGKVKAGKKSVVCGGGLVGAETATHLCMNKRLDFDNRTAEIVEMRSSIAPDEEYTRRIGLLKFLEELKIKCHTDTTVKEITDEGVIVDYEGEEKMIPCDTVVLAFGYKSNNVLYEQLKDKVDIQIVGDANGVANCLKATREGYLAGCNCK